MINEWEMCKGESHDRVLRALKVRVSIFSISVLSSIWPVLLIMFKRICGNMLTAHKVQVLASQDLPHQKIVIRVSEWKMEFVNKITNCENGWCISHLMIIESAFCRQNKGRQKSVKGKINFKTILEPLSHSLSKMKSIIKAKEKKSCLKWRIVNILLFALWHQSNRAQFPNKFSLHCLFVYVFMYLIIFTLYFTLNSQHWYECTIIQWLKQQQMLPWSITVYSLNNITYSLDFHLYLWH